MAFNIRASNGQASKGALQDRAFSDEPGADTPTAVLHVPSDQQLPPLEPPITKHPGLVDIHTTVNALFHVMQNPFISRKPTNHTIIQCSTLIFLGLNVLIYAAGREYERIKLEEGNGHGTIQSTSPNQQWGQLILDCVERQDWLLGLHSVAEFCSKYEEPRALSFAQVVCRRSIADIKVEEEDVTGYTPTLWKVSDLKTVRGCWSLLKAGQEVIGTAYPTFIPVSEDEVREALKFLELRIQRAEKDP